MRVRLDELTGRRVTLDVPGDLVERAAAVGRLLDQLGERPTIAEILQRAIALGLNVIDGQARAELRARTRERAIAESQP